MEDAGRVLTNIQSVPGVKITTSGFNSRAVSESNTSYTHGSNSQRFRSAFSILNLRTCVAGWNYAVGLILTPI
jgi:hypothetical protein